VHHPEPGEGNVRGVVLIGAEFVKASPLVIHCSDTAPTSKVPVPGGGPD
jgi:hypothetical protein